MGKTRDLFKKTGDTKGTFHAKLGTLKERNSKDLIEAKEIKRWQEYWSGWPFPSLGDLPNPGTKPMSLTSPALSGGFLPLAPPGKPGILQFMGLQSGP